MSINAGIGSKTSIGDLVMMGSTPEGLQRLRSIANGPPNPAYPGHLVVAALAQIKSIQEAATQPQPQGTVKDQLLASLQPKPMPTPPSAMGIGAMAQQPQPPAQPAPPQAPPPVQGMAEGGSVQHFETGGDVARQAEDRKRIKDILRGFGDTAVDAVDAGADLVSAVPRGIAGALNSSVIRGANAFGADIPYIPDVEGANYESMTPYTDFRKRERAEEKNNREGRIGTERGRATNRTSAESPVFRAEPPPMADLPIPDVSLTKTDPIAAAIAGSARNRGVGAYQGSAATGRKPYDGTIPDAPDPSSFQLNIPKNQALIDAAAKFSKPDEARMKELRAAEENAGLAAFGAGMIKPGGHFGGVFAGAVRDAVNAKETKAEKRREYEDKREMLATQLGIKVGDDAREDFLKNSDWGNKRAQEAFENGALKVKIKLDAAKAENNDALEAEKIKVQWARIREDAAARSDSKMLQLAERVARNQQEVGNRAYTMAIEKMKAAKPADAAIDPMWESRVTFNANKERARAEDQYMATAGAELLRRAGMGK